MLRAKDARQLVESMRNWVDPCNNFLLADTHGNSGYMCRSRIPIRSMANAWLPVPGWTGEHEWQGQIPFDEMPRSLNPDAGYVATATNRPVGDDYPYYIAIDFAAEFRVKLVTEGLLALDRPRASDMSKVHSQRVSIPALTYIELLRGVEPLDEMSAWAKDKLLAWPGTMDAGSVEPTIYSTCRETPY
jgi:penicillin amidase